MRFSSVRTRITIISLLVVALAYVLGAAGLLYTLHRSLIQGGDDAAKTRAREVAALVQLGAVNTTVPVAGHEAFAQIITSEGDVVAASSNLAGLPRIATFEPPGSAPVVQTMHGVRVATEEQDYRVWALRASSPNGLQIVYIGTNLEPVREALNAVRQALLAGLPLLLGLTGVAAWFVTGRALRPIAAAAEHEQRLVADAAHELRTPLASFRAQLEVALTHPDAVDQRSTLTDLLNESGHLERLVQDLLWLARLDATGPTERRETPVDLDVVVLEEVARIRPHSRIHIDTSGISAGPLRGNREELTRLVRNLLENAEQYATTTVRVEVTTTNGTVQLIVADDGPGIPQQDRQRIFERFTRRDDARSYSPMGAGLGLAIVKEIAERHQGTATVQDHDTGARFVIQLPS